MRKRRSRVYWTRERIIEGLRLFFLHHRHAPCSTEAWRLATLEDEGRKMWDRVYPSWSGILNVFPSFVEAWEAAGVFINRDWLPWSELEDWYLKEACGVLPRHQIAHDLRRGVNAVKRRLYDLGLNTRKRWGWTIHRIERVTGIPVHTIQSYMKRGELPFFRGCHLIYTDPADLLVIKQIDWNNPPPELEREVRRSLMLRLMKIILRQDWRSGSIYQAVNIRKTGKRWGVAKFQAPPRPLNLVTNDLVICKSEDPQCAGRIGEILTVIYSRKMKNTAKQKAEPGWMARVEFKREGQLPRLHRTLPLELLEKWEGANR
ncbi:MAG: hypothetical protein HY231_24030 [Acidobacteria bacterium]|nr:hypothetical protein [Acidobacteriota bacterium]